PPRRGGRGGGGGGGGRPGPGGGAPPETGAGHRLDLIALVVPEQAAAEPGLDRNLSPEHLDIVERCLRAPESIAELASGLDLPVGVIRVLVGDLVDDELVYVTRPVPPAELPDVNILREVINGLRAL
ncbi:DUF742 domain-containing protein, partial [Streptomyces sp. 8L]|uniref:DUF742 domain-containing protein n=1 Tax=Streptomyces sp. 8L TaxID=2877242 RepID=UPI001CD62502